MNSLSKNRLHLGIQAVLFFFPALFISMAIHEIGHGLGALLTGGSFHGFHVTFFTGNSFISGQSSNAQRAFSAAAGSSFAAIIGVALFVLIRKRHMKWRFTLFSMYLAFICLIDLPAHMFFSGLPLRGGDFVGFAELTHIPTILVVFVGFLGVALVLYLFTGLFARALAGFFSFDTYWNRFSVFLLFLVLPACIAAIGSAVDPYNSRSGVRGFAIMAVFSLILSAVMAFTRIRSPQTLGQLSRSSSLTGLAVFSLALITWFGVFGTRMQERGLLWSAPPEKEVVCWNLVLSLLPSHMIKADVLMRPTVLEMFWRKQKSTEPNWSLYDSLAWRNAQRILPSVRWTAVEHLQDDTVQYSLFGMESRGARRATLSGSLPESVLGNATNGHVLELACDSLTSSYAFYKLEIRAESPLCQRSCELNSSAPSKASIDSPHRLVIEDQNLRGLKTIKVSFAQE